jgi:hypothetical protein
MRKSLCLFVFACVCLAGQAQSGFKGSVGLSRIDFPGNSSLNARLSFAGGFIQQFKLAPKVKLQTELLFARKGYAPPGGADQINLDYVSLPVLAHIKLGKVMHVLAGPEASYLVQDNWQSAGLGPVNKWDVGASAGFGYQVSKFGLDLRFTQGITKVFSAIEVKDWQGNTTRIDARGRNQVLMLSAYVVL